MLAGVNIGFKNSINQKIRNVTSGDERVIRHFINLINSSHFFKNPDRINSLRQNPTCPGPSFYVYFSITFSLLPCAIQTRRRQIEYDNSFEFLTKAGRFSFCNIRVQLQEAINLGLLKYLFLKFLRSKMQVFRSLDDK